VAAAQEAAAASASVRKIWNLDQLFGAEDQVNLAHSIEITASVARNFSGAINR